jgi:hypothetical protein
MIDLYGSGGGGGRGFGAKRGSKSFLRSSS